MKRPAGVVVSVTQGSREPYANGYEADAGGEQQRSRLENQSSGEHQGHSDGGEEEQRETRSVWRIEESLWFHGGEPDQQANSQTEHRYLDKPGGAEERDPEKESDRGHTNRQIADDGGRSFRVVALLARHRSFTAEMISPRPALASAKSINVLSS